MKKETSNRVDTVRRLLEMHYFHDDVKIDFFNSIILDDIKEIIDEDDKANGKHLHDLEIKRMLKKNDIQSGGDDEK